MLTATGVKKQVRVLDCKQDVDTGLPGGVGYVLLCTVALFFRSVAWKGGRLNPEVSKSHSRCVASR